MHQLSVHSTSHYRTACHQILAVLQEDSSVNGTEDRNPTARIGDWEAGRERGREGGEREGERGERGGREGGERGERGGRGGERGGREGEREGERGRERLPLLIKLLFHEHAPILELCVILHKLTARRRTLSTILAQSMSLNGWRELRAVGIIHCCMIARITFEINICKQQH